MLITISETRGSPGLSVRPCATSTQLLINFTLADFSTPGDPVLADVSVTDHGIGIPKEDQGHLFSSFFRGANAANIQGTGLGLHIVKRYVDLLGGDVHLQSELNKGTKVIFEIPTKQK